MRIMIVGSGAREHAIARALARSKAQPMLFCFGNSQNPGIQALTLDYWIDNICALEKVGRKAREWHIDMAIIGPEAPLEQGLVDYLQQQGIPTIGPSKALAQLESSKIFTRKLLERYHIPGSPAFRCFTDLTGVADYLQVLGEGQYVIKADGLMGGKGVKVAGDHLQSIQEAIQFCEDLINKGHSFIIEEKLIGQEFSMLSFCDGEHLVPMPLVQDHKRAFVDDKGPNTGGMGSYSDANHSLPFLTPEEVIAAQQINEAVLKALTQTCQARYQGILYGSFIATKSGVKLIEYNARFGDPEALNVLAILESDFIAICQAMISGDLCASMVRFKPMATVCKYAVPLGYPDCPQVKKPIDISTIKNPEQLYFANVNVDTHHILTSTSRALAVVGIAPTISEAELIAEQEINRIQGALFHREDIGQARLINQRIQMMQGLRETVSA